MEFLSIVAGPDAVPYWEVLLALMLGALLGSERTLARKTAGLRTYGLVAMGAALFTTTGLAAAPDLAVFGNIDPLRVAAAIITGVGFLGAGVILFRNSTLTGLTTAAGLWVAAGIGVAVGLEFYALAIFTTVVTLLVFTLFWFLEQEVEEIKLKK